MIDEVTDGVGNEAERYPNGYEWLTTTHAAIAEGCTERTIQNRVSKGEYEVKRESGRLFVKVPNKLQSFVNVQQFTTPLPIAPEPITAPTVNVSAIDEALLNRFMELSDRVLNVSEDLADAKAKLAEKTSEVTILNRELAARGEMIVKLKDKTKPWWRLWQ
jgi:hypothetical protein